ncbi:MAG: site-specific integrase [Actinobacteria bacterium]|nr:site-specific integrase [Actinomycetota bacterium]
MTGSRGKYRTRVEGDVLSGAYIDPAGARETVAAFVTEWRRSVVDLRPTTLARLDATVRHQVLPTFGHLPLSGISNADVRAWAAGLRADGLSVSTTRKAVFALRRILAAAVADRRLPSNPAHEVPLPGDEAREQRFLTAEEVADLADAAVPRFRAFVLLAAYGGLRFGEMAALRRRSIDLLRARVKVSETLVELNGSMAFGPTKTQNGQRTVPLPRRVAAELAEHLERYCARDVDALAFTTVRGAPLRRAAFGRDVWRPAVEAAGLDPLTCHQLRHTFVSLWVAAGVDLGTISKRAGHSSAAFTEDRCRHLYEDADDKIADRLDALLEALGPSHPAPVVGPPGPAVVGPRGPRQPR